MTPKQASERAALYTRTVALITRLSDGTRDDHARDDLLLDIARYQARWVAPYARYVAQRLRGGNVASIADMPALPTDAFRFARISSRAPDDDVRTFVSSGTTQRERSLHPLADLSLYDLSAEHAARYALFPDVPRLKLVILAPPESELASSSLSYMLARFVAWFGRDISSYVWPTEGAHIARLTATLRHAESTHTPVALLGTSFAFVHALDALAGAHFALPPTSRIMQTGGFKGRSREVPAEDMRRQLAHTFGVDEALIVAEYGMTELSSQLYESTLRDALLGQPRAPRSLWAPPWVRASIVHHETLLPLAGDEPGLVRIDDLANLDSVSAIQTADLGRREGAGIVLLGRAQGAIARGCSITADELLGGGGR